VAPPPPPPVGWYANSFSHGRRIIGADPSLPANNPAVAVWDGRDCMSNWALNGRGAGGGASGASAGAAAAAAAGGGGSAPGSYSSDPSSAAEEVPADSSVADGSGERR
jgi:hypothetical protein